MNFHRYIKYLCIFLLIFLLGAQNSYAKSELFLPQNQVSFSIEQNQSFKSLEKVIQTNIGFQKEKFTFEVFDGVSIQSQRKFSIQKMDAAYLKDVLITSNNSNYVADVVNDYTLAVVHNGNTSNLLTIERNSDGFYLKGTISDGASSGTECFTIENIRFRNSGSTQIEEGALKVFVENGSFVVRRLAEAGTKWLDDLEAVLGAGSKNKIQGWIDDGLDVSKVELSFANTSNKSKLFSDLDNALSIQHRRILVDDLDNVPGLTIGNRNENSYPNGHILENTKVTLPDGSFDPDLSITYSGDVMSFVNGTANLVELPSGTKLYRVCNDGDGAFTGGYWTRTKPNNLDEVIGGTAVQPEWNSFNNVVEYTVPNGQTIWVWEGNAASQKLSNNLNLSNPHLAGGGEQILIPLKYRRIKKPDGTFDFGGIEQSFLDNIIPLPNSQIPWK